MPGGTPRCAEAHPRLWSDRYRGGRDQPGPVGLRTNESRVPPIHPVSVLALIHSSKVLLGECYRDPCIADSKCAGMVPPRGVPCRGAGLPWLMVPFLELEVYINKYMSLARTHSRDSAVRGRDRSIATSILGLLLRIRCASAPWRSRPAVTDQPLDSAIPEFLIWNGRVSRVGFMSKCQSRSGKSP